MHTERVTNTISWFVNRYQLTWGKLFGLFCAVVFLGISIFFANVSANIASFWCPVKAYNYPLSDLGIELFNVTNRTEAYNNAVDALLISFCCVTGALVLINRLAVFIAFKLLICIGLGYTLRISTLLVTSLPDPWNIGTRTTIDTYSHFARRRGGDLIYSGHTMLICMFAHAWSSFYLLTDSYLLHWLTAIIAWLYVLLVMILIVVGGMHYTVDILIALYISAGIWWAFSYFETRFFEDPVAKMKFRSVPVAPLNSSSLDPHPAQNQEHTLAPEV